MHWDDNPLTDDASVPPQEPASIDFTPVGAFRRPESTTDDPSASADGAPGGFSFAPINYADRLRQPVAHSEGRGPITPPALRPGDRYAVGGASYLYQMPPEELVPGLESSDAAQPAPSQPALPFAPAEADESALQAYQRQYWAHLRQLSDTTSRQSAAPTGNARDAEPPTPPEATPFSAHSASLWTLSSHAVPISPAEPPAWEIAAGHPPARDTAPANPSAWEGAPTHPALDRDEPSTSAAPYPVPESDLPRPVPVKQATSSPQAIPDYLKRKPGEASAPVAEPGRAFPHVEATPTSAASDIQRREPSAQDARAVSDRPQAIKAPPSLDKRAKPGRNHKVEAKPAPDNRPHAPIAPALGAHMTASPTSAPVTPPHAPASSYPPPRQPASPIPAAVTPRQPRAPIPAQPAHQTGAKRAPRAPKPPRQCLSLGRRIALWACVAGIAACVVLMATMVGTLLQNERDVAAMREEYAQQNGQPLDAQGGRVALLPPGETYVPTVTPIPEETPTATPVLAIHDGALGPLTTPASATPAPATRAKPAPYANLAVREAMGLLRADYPELVGWLTMGDLIDAPVAQSTNRYYQTHDARRQSDISGAIYLDEHFTLRTPPENLLICGANQPERLGPLQGFRSGGSAFLSKYGVFRLDTLYEEGQYVVFALFDVGTNPTQSNYFNYTGYVLFSTDAQFTNYVRAARARSLWSTDIEVQPSDRLVTLAVPNDDAAGTRLIVMARRLREGEDPAALTAALLNAKPVQPQP